MHSLNTPAAMLFAVTLLTACSDGQRSYYPLAKGLWWEYRLQVSTARGNSEGRYLVTNLGSRVLDGEPVTVREVHDGSRYFYTRRADGLYRLGSRAGLSRSMPGASSPHLVIPTPAARGATWTAPSITSVLARPIGAYEKKLVNIMVTVPMVYTIQSADAAVRVPAGRFGHCLRIHSQGRKLVDVGGVIGETEVAVENTDWFAPGVGLVKTTHRETTGSPHLPGGSFVLELNAFHQR